MTLKTEVTLVLSKDGVSVQTKTEIELSMIEYLTAARQEGLAVSTVKQYEWQLDRLAGWLTQHQVVEPGQLSRSLLREWGASLWDGWQDASVFQAVCVARAWLGWLRDERVLVGDLRDCLKLPIVKKRIQRTLTADEITMLLAGCDKTTAMGRRNAALISLLLDSGLRAAEICRLCWKDLDLPHYRLVVVVKGGNQELGHYGPETVERLEAWERDWQKFRNSGVEAVFIALRGWTPGQPLTKKGLQRLLSNLGEAQGIPNVSPHAFRRAFACLLIEQGAPNRLVQAFGRWQNETMVKRYTAGLEASRLYEQYSPTNFLKQVKATE